MLDENPFYNDYKMTQAIIKFHIELDLNHRKYKHSF